MNSAPDQHELTDQLPDFPSLANQPYALLAAMDALLRGGDSVTGPQDSWEGLGVEVGGLSLLIPRGDVREIIPTPHATRVPGAQRWMRGVANVRGTLVQLVDPAVLYGLPPSRSGDSALLLNSDSVPAAFCVDRVLGYRQFSLSEQRHALTRDMPAQLQPDLLGGFVQGNDVWLVLSLLKLALSPRFSHQTTSAAA